MPSIWSFEGSVKKNRSSKSAGGWPALASSMKFVVDSKDIPKSLRALRSVNQPDGFDCPGCAWPDPGEPSLTEFCENGVKAVAAETTAGRVNREFFASHPVGELLKQTDYWLERQGRLTEPMVYRPESDTYVPITWGEAFRLVGDVLGGLSSPDEAVFYTSGRTSNEAAFLYQLFVRLYGTNNLPDCSDLCHQSSGVAMTEALGIGKGTVTLEDFGKADTILVLGQNPGTNHPRMLTELQKARLRGANVVTLNPLVERGLESFVHPQHPGAMLTNRGTPISSLYLQPLIAGDLAALKGIMKWVLDFESQSPGKVLDWDFIRSHCQGFEVFKRDIEETEWSLIETQSGLSRRDLRRVAEIYVQSERVIACWAMGLTQHKHAVSTIQQVLNLLLLRGNLGREGAGACPVRGHSNVQGDRTMGINENPPQSFLDRLEEVYGFKVPRQPGWDTVEAIRAMHEGRVKVLVCMGGNFARATPDTSITEESMGKCQLTVQISTKLNRSHLTRGKQALILPCLGRTEVDMQKSGPQRVTVEDSMSMVHASEGKLPPASVDLRSEPWIVAGLAKAVLAESPVDWDGLVENYDAIRNEISRVVPGFHEFNQRIDQRGGFYLGNSAAKRDWLNKVGRALFTVAPIPDLSLPEGVFRLMTIRSHDQYNTTVYGLDDRYRNVRGERRIVFINEADLQRLGFEEGDLVDLTSDYGDGAHRCAPSFRLRSYDIPRGCLASYFPETNVLVSLDSTADGSRTPVSKFIPVRLSKAQPTLG
ncbi:MAG: FdhF/YdeP family oxidoreductase [Limisphaerales bacterium]